MSDTKKPQTPEPRNQFQRHVITSLAHIQGDQHIILRILNAMTDTNPALKAAILKQTARLKESTDSLKDVVDANQPPAATGKV